MHDDRLRGGNRSPRVTRSLVAMGGRVDCRLALSAVSLSNMSAANPNRILLIACLAIAGLGGSCAPPATEGGFESPNPASRMYAVERAAQTRDYTAIKDIIEQLDADDPGLRMLAINALERLTGRTYGYHHYDPRPERDAAIRRWQAAYEAGELDAPAHPTSAATENTEEVRRNG